MGQRNTNARNVVPVWLRSVWHTLLDTIFPPKCLVCHRLFQPASARSAIDRLTHKVAEIRDLLLLSHRWLSALCCPECVKTVTAISEPLCTCCGIGRSKMA